MTHTPEVKAQLASHLREQLYFLRSVSVKNFAVSGKSDRIKKDAIAHSTVASPSRMKIQAQLGLPPTPSIFAIAAARSPPSES